jgi:phage shock protein C
MAAYVRRQALIPAQQGRVIAGACAGVGRRFGLSPWTARG